MKFNFLKMQGAGNDFIFLDSMHMQPPQFHPKEIEYFCDRNFGVGADGFVLLTASKEAHAEWLFINSDGTEAEMCGNAARCAIRLLADKHFPDEIPLSIKTKAGIIKGKPLDKNLVEIALLKSDDGKFEYEQRVLKVDDLVLDIFITNTGVPHAVIEVKDLSTYPIEKIGKLLLHHPMFGKEGTNVTFFEREVGQSIRSTTFERGVEKETFACGTGVAAAAIVYSHLFLQPFPINVTAPGGLLTVDLSPVSKYVLLQGPAHYLFEVSIEDMPMGYEKRRLYSEKGPRK